LPSSSVALKVPKYLNYNSDIKRLEQKVEQSWNIFNKVKHIDNSFNGRTADSKLLLNTRALPIKNNYADIEKYMTSMRKLETWKHEANFVTMLRFINYLNDQNLLDDDEFYEIMSDDDNYGYGGIERTLVKLETTKYKDSDINRLRNIVTKWSLDNPGMNVYPLINVYKTVREYEVVDNSVELKLLYDEREQLIKYGLNHLIETVDDITKEIKYKLEMSEKMSKLTTITNIAFLPSEVSLNIHNYTIKIDPFDFIAVYGPSPNTGARFLVNMHKVAASTPGGIEWIKTDGSLYSVSELGKKLMYNPLIESDGHSGGSMSWTLGTLKYCYKIGWDEWLKQYIENVIKKNS
jgi:hypothetical protein